MLAKQLIGDLLAYNALICNLKRGSLIYFLAIKVRPKEAIGEHSKRKNKSKLKVI